MSVRAKQPPTLQELRGRRDEILELAARYGASNVRVFGSVARGEADERSDVDFLVDMDEGRTLFDMGALFMDLQDALEREVMVTTVAGLRPRIREAVLKDAVAL
jgi:predicted nucleotidyltransferase